MRPHTTLFKPPRAFSHNSFKILDEIVVNSLNVQSNLAIFADRAIHLVSRTIDTLHHLGVIHRDAFEPVYCTALPRYQSGDYIPYQNALLSEWNSDHLQADLRSTLHPLILSWLGILGMDAAAVDPKCFVLLSNQQASFTYTTLYNALASISRSKRCATEESTPGRGDGVRTPSGATQVVMDMVRSLITSICSHSSVLVQRMIQVSSDESDLREGKTKNVVFDWVAKHAPKCLPLVIDVTGQSRDADRDSLNAVEAYYRLSKSLPNVGGVAMRLNKAQFLHTMSSGGNVFCPMLYKGVSTFLSPYVHVAPSSRRIAIKVLNKWFPPTSETDNKHMTTHISSLVYNCLHRPTEMVKLFSAVGHSTTTTPKRTGQYLNYLLKNIPVCTPQALVIATVIPCMWPNSNNDSDALLGISQSGILQRNSVSLKKSLSYLSTFMRRTQLDMHGESVTVEQLSVAAYLEMHFGRSNNNSDWPKEIANRTSGTYHISESHPDKVLPNNNLVTEKRWSGYTNILDLPKDKPDPRFYDKLERELLILCKPLIKKRNITENFQSFFKRRNDWMSSGSSGGYSVDVDVIKGGQVKKSKVRLGKRAWGENVKFSTMWYELYKAKPVEKSIASEKKEHKPRAIYGVNPEHYFINTYATMGFEERLHLIPGLEKGLTGLSDVAAQVKRTMITSDPLTECTMMDHADFNIIHSPTAMAILFKVFAAIGEEAGACRDWIRANEYIAESKFDMRCSYPNGRGNFLHVKQGMFSGTRSTDLINHYLIWLIST